MKIWLVVGILFLALGSTGLALKEISFNTKKNVVNLGPLKLDRQDKNSIEIPEWASGAALGAGAVLVLAGWRGKKR